MKRKELLRHLRSQGCEFVREGAKHSWWYESILKQEIGRSEAQ